MIPSPSGDPRIDAERLLWRALADLRDKAPPAVLDALAADAAELAGRAREGERAGDVTPAQRAE